MKKRYVIELIIISVVLLFGLARFASKKKQSPEMVSVEGMSELLSQNTIEKLAEMPLPEGMHLKVRIDSLCKANDYLNEIRAGENMIEIQVYESPLLIKAAMDSRSNVELRGRYGGEYVHTQMLYLNTGDIDYAVEQMAEFMCRVNAESNIGLNWFQRTFGQKDIGKWIDDGLYFLASIFKPYNNFWGKVIVRPVYKLALWSVSKTHSITRGIAMLAVIGGFLILLFYIYATLFVDKEENQLFVAILMKIPKYLYLCMLFIISYNIARPNLETIYALNDVYGVGCATPLKLCYTCYNYCNSSLGLTIFAIILFSVFEIEKYLVGISFNPTEENIEKNTNAFTQDEGMKCLDIATFICCAALLDRMVLLVVVIYLIVAILVKFIEAVMVHSAIDSMIDKQHSSII